MSEKITEEAMENTENQNNTEIIRVNAFFVLHEDSFNEIVQSMILLKDYRETWKLVKKRNKYYLFFDNNRKYLKLWTDSKRNLLFYVGEVNNNLFYDSIEIREYNTGCVIFTDNSVQCNEKVIEFKNIAFFDLIRQIDYRLIDPIIWLLCTTLY